MTLTASIIIKNYKDKYNNLSYNLIFNIINYFNLTTKDYSELIEKFDTFYNYYFYNFTK